MELDRRAAVLAAGVLGFGLMSACKQEGGQETGSEKSVSANEDLMREHGVLRRILILYRETAPKVAMGTPGLDIPALAAAAALFRDFGEVYHERELEERYIFPALRKGANGALVETLLAQHRRGREITAFIAGSTRDGAIATGRAKPLAAAMTSFARMYEAHTAREDTVIFPAFKAALPERRLEELSETFEDIEHRQFGGDGFDQAVDRIAEIEQRLGVADLGTFTAPEPA